MQCHNLKNFQILVSEQEMQIKACVQLDSVLYHSTQSRLRTVHQRLTNTTLMCYSFQEARQPHQKLQSPNHNYLYYCAYVHVIRFFLF